MGSPPQRAATSPSTRCAHTPAGREPRVPGLAEPGPRRVGRGRADGGRSLRGHPVAVVKRLPGSRALLALHEAGSGSRVALGASVWRGHREASSLLLVLRRRARQATQGHPGRQQGRQRGLGGTRAGACAVASEGRAWRGGVGVLRTGEAESRRPCGCRAGAVAASLVPGPGVRRAGLWPEVAVDWSAHSGALVPGESLSCGAGRSWEERSPQRPQSPGSRASEMKSPHLGWRWPGTWHLCHQGPRLGRTQDNPGPPFFWRPTRQALLALCERHPEPAPPLRHGAPTQVPQPPLSPGRLEQPLPPLLGPLCPVLPQRPE